MSALSDLLLNSPPYVVQLQLIELTHSAFSADFRIVRNLGREGATISVTHEGPAGPFTYEYFPLQIRMVGSGNDLDQSMEVTFGDLGSIVPTQLNSVAALNKFNEKPVLKYREYSSQDLSAPVYGPLEFRVDAIAFNHTGCVLKAKAATFNQGRIGVYYTDELFPMLKNVT